MRSHRPTNHLLALLLLLAASSSEARRSSRPLDFSAGLVGVEARRDNNKHGGNGHGDSFFYHGNDIIPEQVLNDADFRSGGGEATTENPNWAPEGYICMEKVMMVTETVYEEKEQCQHVSQKSCFTSYKMRFKPVKVEDCEDHFKRDCYIKYKEVARQQEVTVCKDNVSRDCQAEGEEVCTKQPETVCETVNHLHEVSDDVAECGEVREENCIDGGDVCNDVPRQVCNVTKETRTKVSPRTDCRVIEIEVCGKEACPIVVGEPICKEETKTFVQSIPSESCRLIPLRECRDETRMVPELVPEEDCVDVPREVCVTLRIPKKVTNPRVKKWCGPDPNYNPEQTTEEEEEEEGFFEPRPATDPTEYFADVFVISPAVVGFLTLDPDNHDCLDRFTFEADVPFESTVGMNMMMSNNSVVHICGGGSDVCYTKDLTNPAQKAAVNPDLKLTTARTGAFAIETRANEFWITGGRDAGGSILRSTEILRDGEILPGPDLPVALVNHCMARINHTHLLIHGGFSSAAGNVQTNRAYIFDIEMETTVEVAASSAPRSGHVCGMSLDDTDESRKIFVVGGTEDATSVEIYSVNEDAWTTGASLSGNAYDSKSIQLEDTFQVFDEDGTIWEYDVTEKEWTSMPKSLGSSGAGALVLPAPEALTAKCLEMPAITQ